MTVLLDSDSGEESDQTSSEEEEIDYTVVVQNYAQMKQDQKKEERFDEDGEDHLLCRQMRMRYEIADKVVTEFRDLYRGDIEPKLDNFVAEGFKAVKERRKAKISIRVEQGATDANASAVTDENSFIKQSTEKSDISAAEFDTTPI